MMNSNAHYNSIAAVIVLLLLLARSSYGAPLQSPRAASVQVNAVMVTPLTVRLTWSAVPTNETFIAYAVYWGEKATNRVNVGKALNLVIPVTKGRSYEAAVTAIVAEQFMQGAFNCAAESVKQVTRFVIKRNGAISLL